MIYQVVFRGSLSYEPRIDASSPHDALRLARSRLEPQTLMPHSFRPESVEAEDGNGSLWLWVGDCEACKVPVFGCDGGISTEDNCTFCPPCSAKLRAHVEAQPHPEPLLVDGDLEDENEDERSAEDEAWERARADRERDRLDDPTEDAWASALDSANERLERAEDLLRALTDTAKSTGAPVGLCPLLSEARVFLGGDR